MKSEEKLLREMGISSWSLKRNFSFDGYSVIKKGNIEISKPDLKFIKSFNISFRQQFSGNYPDEILSFLASKGLNFADLNELRKLSSNDKKELLIKIEKN